MAAPIPALAPVTTATRPDQRSIVDFACNYFLSNRNSLKLMYVYISYNVL
jgi:hypothetical protein